ncbi:MAG: CbiX/SirB N-terminal domain-containing protein [Polyangiaceae bacterium]
MADKVVLLVGHGGVPSDFPRDALTRLKALEGRRRATHGPMSEEERALDRQIRGWPRTPENDPYQAGLERIAEALAPKLRGAALAVAYNEFCGPSLEEAVERAIESGATEITVIPSMLTPGGVHSEVEIPETLASLREAHPKVTLRYAWPFDMDRVTDMLAAHALGQAV